MTCPYNIAFKLPAKLLSEYVKNAPSPTARFVIKNTSHFLHFLLYWMRHSS